MKKIAAIVTLVITVLGLVFFLTTPVLAFTDEELKQKLLAGSPWECFNESAFGMIKYELIVNNEDKLVVEIRGGYTPYGRGRTGPAKLLSEVKNGEITFVTGNGFEYNLGLSEKTSQLLGRACGLGRCDDRTYVSIVTCNSSAISASR